MGKGNRQGHEFRVTVGGITLSPEQQEELNRAVQQASLHVMAGIDFGGDRVALAIPIRNGTRGIRYVVAAESAVQQVLASGET